MTTSPAEVRAILHVDIDAFYASVEVLDDPSLAGKPVVIGADPRGGRGRGVVCTASYEARQYGIHSAMPISHAWRRCPDAVYLPPRMERYVESSRRFMAILRRYTDLVEPLSIDEAFLDVTHSQRLFGTGVEIARRIQRETREEEGLAVSVGVAPSKFVAKIGSDLEKPKGLVVVESDQVVEFLDPLSVARLFGAGKVAQEKFARLRIRTIGDVRRRPIEELSAALGDAVGHHFHELANGIDDREVVPDRVRKSLGKETTFDVDRRNRGEVLRTLLELSTEVASGLRAGGFEGRCVTVKLRTEDFKTRTRSRTLRDGVDRVDQIWPVAQELFTEADETALAIRLIGLSCSNLAEKGQQGGLFDAPDPRAKVAETMDAVTRRFGDAALRPGALLPEPRRDREAD